MKSKPIALIRVPVDRDVTNAMSACALMCGAEMVFALLKTRGNIDRRLGRTRNLHW